jgi:hypothetical protein
MSVKKSVHFILQALSHVGRCYSILAPKVQAVKEFSQAVRIEVGMWVGLVLSSNILLAFLLASLV